MKEDESIASKKVLEEEGDHLKKERAHEPRRKAWRSHEQKARAKQALIERSCKIEHQTTESTSSTIMITADTYEGAPPTLQWGDSSSWP